MTIDERLRMRREEARLTALAARARRLEAAAALTSAEASKIARRFTDLAHRQTGGGPR